MTPSERYILHRKAGDKLDEVFCDDVAKLFEVFRTSDSEVPRIEAAKHFALGISKLLDDLDAAKQAIDVALGG